MRTGDLAAAFVHLPLDGEMNHRQCVAELEARLGG
jgi:hypothetical protein